MHLIDIVIVDQRPLIREGLEHVLRSPSFAVVASARSLREALSLSHQRPRPDLVLFSSSAEESLAAQLAEIEEQAGTLPRMHYVLVTDIDNPRLLQRAMMVGVNAVLSKQISGDVLCRSLDLVVLGQRLFPPSLINLPPSAPVQAIEVMDKAPPAEAALQAGEDDDAPDHWACFGQPLPETPPGINLSEREIQILRYLVRGFSNKAAAREMKITEATVKVHVKGLMRKIRATNRTQAAIWALQNGEYINHASGKVIDLPVASPPARPASM